MIGKEVPEPALRRVTELDDEALGAAYKDLIAGGFLYEHEIYPERVLAFSHPLTREVAYGSQLSGQRAAAHAATARAMIELNPERHDELAALIAQHLEQGAETLEAARWSARAPTGPATAIPEEALRLWSKVTELAAELPESDESQALAVSSRMLQLDYGWRLGMNPKLAAGLLSEAREIATRIDDLRSLAMLELLSSLNRGTELDAGTWTASGLEAVRLADSSGDDALRVATRVAACYSLLSAGQPKEVERLLDEADEIAGGDRSMGSGLMLGCPVAWGLMARGVLRREEGDFDRAEELSKEALRIAANREIPRPRAGAGETCR